jgi:hypothetical protein
LPFFHFCSRVTDISVQVSICDAHPCFRVRLSVGLTLSNLSLNSKLTISLGLLSADGSEHTWETYEASNYRKESVFVATKPHAELNAAASSLMPNGRLTIFVEIRNVVKYRYSIGIQPLQGHTTTPAPRDLPPENISGVMLDNFVDLNNSSVLLVFEDGEQRCHTFPLAARQRVFKCCLQIQFTLSYY